jgi:predicted RNase H-like nuclease
MDAASVVPAKRTAAGAESRTGALRAAGIEPPTYVRGQGYAANDLLDACAVAWTAARVARGDAETLPAPPETFSDGLPAAIHV